MSFNVLIVDDSASMRSVIKKVIKVSGFNVGEIIEAGDGVEALLMLQDIWVDLVLSDINMPNMNGLELIAKMSENEILKSIPVVMITTEGSEEKMKKAKVLGAAGYIKKPFLPIEIKTMLSDIMGEEMVDERNIDDEDAGCDF